VGLAGPRRAVERLVLLAGADALYHGTDCFGLIAFGLVAGIDFEWHVLLL
jgi:hypothetical protein